MLFAFNGECDDFDKWLQEKAKQLNADNRGDTVDAAKRKFEVRKPSDKPVLLLHTQRCKDAHLW